MTHSVVVSYNIRRNYLLKDIIILATSIFIAIFLVRTDILGGILTSTKELEIIGSFVAGMFFTTVFTTAPSIVTLGEIANTSSVLLVAFFGALGAVVGDIIIFRFVRDRLSEHLMELLSHKGVGKRIKALLKFKYFRWISFLVGGLIIASPFPDELGISLLGFSKMEMVRFIPLSFLFNFLGIVIIGLVAQTL